MSKAEHIANVHHIPVNEAQQRLGDLDDLFSEKGISVSRSELSRIRSGIRNAEQINRRLDLVEVVEHGVTEKDQYYKSIADTGIETRIRRPQRNRYTPVHFMEGISSELGINIQETRRSFRAMRCELTFSSLTPDGKEYTDTFRSTAEEYLAEFAHGAEVPISLKRIDDEWDRKSIDGFYRLFSEHVQWPTTAQTFPPYEVDAFSTFYQGRLDKNSPATYLDVITANINATHTSPDPVFAAIRSMTGVKYDSSVHFNHIRALISKQ